MVTVYMYMAWTWLHQLNFGDVCLSAAGGILTGGGAGPLALRLNSSQGPSM